MRASRHVAASKGCYALAKWLIKKQHVDVNPIDQDGRTPLAVPARSHCSVHSYLTSVSQAKVRPCR